MTIPNLLTFVRIFLTPLLAWFVLRKSMTAAFFVFLIAGLTDALDGLFARVLNQKSRLGSLIDPLADKILLVTSFVLLWNIGEIPLWLVSITVGRDLSILCGFFILVFCKVQFEVKPLASSKLTTFFQLGTVFALLGKPVLELHGWMYTVLFFTTAGFSILSWAQYLFNGLSLLKRHRAQSSCGAHPETPDETPAASDSDFSTSKKRDFSSPDQVQGRLLQGNQGVELSSEKKRTSRSVNNDNVVRAGKDPSRTESG